MILLFFIYIGDESRSSCVHPTVEHFWNPLSRKLLMLRLAVVDFGDGRLSPHR